MVFLVLASFTAQARAGGMPSRVNAAEGTTASDSSQPSGALLLAIASRNISSIDQSVTFEGRNCFGEMRVKRFGKQEVLTQLDEIDGFTLDIKVDSDGSKTIEYYGPGSIVSQSYLNAGGNWKILSGHTLTTSNFILPDQTTGLFTLNLRDGTVRAGSHKIARMNRAGDTDTYTIEVRASCDWIPRLPH